MKPLPPYVEEHLASLDAFYSHAPKLNWAGLSYRKLIAHYLQFFIPADASVLEIGCGDGTLLSLLPNQQVTGVDLSQSQIEKAQKKVPRGKFHLQRAEQLQLEGVYDYIILSDTINHAADVQLILQHLHKVAHPQTRLVLNFFNSVWKPFLNLAEVLGLKNKSLQNNWLSVDDVRNLLEMTEWQVVKVQSKILFPIEFPILERLINRWVQPWLSEISLTVFCLARPVAKTAPADYTVSIIIPARNEAGNIENAILRTPSFGKTQEFIFVEGHSTDRTWSTIQEIKNKYPDRNIKILQQSGKGKGNAVREGFDISTGELLMILDADLTMPPEELPKYYSALASGYGEFANGVRLVYPMKDQAMPFLNQCANKFFSIAFTWLLGQSVKDTLCGTKTLFKCDYDKIAANRAYFGDFDPFGDFDLLFGADKLGLKIVDIPIRYQDRVYGQTNIQRWRHGWLLLRMTLYAAQKLKFI